MNVDISKLKVGDRVRIRNGGKYKCTEITPKRANNVWRVCFDKPFTYGGSTYWYYDKVGAFAGSIHPYDIVYVVDRKPTSSTKSNGFKLLGGSNV